MVLDTQKYAEKVNSISFGSLCHKSEGANDVFQFSTIAVAIQVSSTCSKQQSYHWTLIRGPGIFNASLFLKTVKEVIGKTCG